MMKWTWTAALALLLGIPAVPASAQTVPIITLDNLEKRLEAGADTTFVVNFWATWCGPCVREMPYFEALDRSRAKVLLVSLDFEDVLGSKVIPFIQKKGITSEVMLLEQGDPNEWIPRVSHEWSGAIPATLFVNTAKRIRGFHEGSFAEGELESKLTGLGL
jgi:thiol-disulfide isomerase/thioredoxin